MLLVKVFAVVVKMYARIFTAGLYFVHDMIKNQCIDLEDNLI